MTDSEKNAISAGMLVAAKMTEMFLDFWCRMEHATLTGKHKQIFNMMGASCQVAAVLLRAVDGQDGDGAL